MRTVLGWVLGLLVVIGVGVAVVAAVGAGAQAQVGVGQPAPFGTVDGQIIQVGGPAGNPNLEVRGPITLTNTSSGATYDTFSSSTSGYSVEVPPGTYNVTGSSLEDYSDGQPMDAYDYSPPVRLRAGSRVHVDLYVNIP